MKAIIVLAFVACSFADSQYDQYYDYKDTRSRPQEYNYRNIPREYTNQNLYQEPYEQDRAQNYDYQTYPQESSIQDFNDDGYNYQNVAQDLYATNNQYGRDNWSSGDDDGYSVTYNGDANDDGRSRYDNQEDSAYGQYDNDQNYTVNEYDVVIQSRKQPERQYDYQYNYQ